MQCLATAHGIEGVASTLHVGYVDFLACLGGEPFAAIEAVAHLLVQLIARGIAQGKAKDSPLLAQHLVWQVGTEGQWLVAHGQRHGSSMGLAGLVGDIGGDHKVIEHGVACLGHHDGHADGERSVIASDGLALGKHLVIAVTAYDHLIPITIIGEPPEGAFPCNLILHLRALHLHAAIGTGGTCDIDGVAVGVGCLHAGYLHLKRRPLILLYTERFAVGAVVFAVAPFANGLDGIDTSQPRLRQCEVGGTGAVFIGDNFLRGHSLVVGIVKFHGDLNTCINGVLCSFIAMVEDSGGVNSLARTVHLTVGIDAAAIAFRTAFIIAKTARLGDTGAVLVVFVSGEHIAVALFLLLGVDILAFRVSGSLV